MNLTRRQFINLTTATAAGIMYNAMDTFSSPLTVSARPGYELLIFGTSWGYTQGWDNFAEAIKQEGYDGTEMWYVADERERRQTTLPFEKRGLRIGYLVGAQEADYATHFKKFKDALNGAATQKPVYINCHSGRDHFSFEQNQAFIDLGIEVSEKTGVPVFHETHRSRILFAAPVARRHFEHNERLRITLDISHWCNVHESYLDDQQETVAMALNRAGHIHARIGHPEGPQVSDPRAPEWKQAVAAHFAWWDTVVTRHRNQGKRITFLTEFGPPDYMPTLPYTRQPIANQWEINKHMMDVLQARYA